MHSPAAHETLDEQLFEFVLKPDLPDASSRRGFQSHSLERERKGEESSSSYTYICRLNQLCFMILNLIITSHQAGGELVNEPPRPPSENV